MDASQECQDWRSCWRRQNLHLHKSISFSTRRMMSRREEFTWSKIFTLRAFHMWQSSTRTTSMQTVSGSMEFKENCQGHRRSKVPALRSRRRHTCQATGQEMKICSSISMIVEQDSQYAFCNFRIDLWYRYSLVFNPRDWGDNQRIRL